MIGPPALCRLCRRPIPRGAVKCPYCRARLSWSAPAREARRGWGGWRIAAGAMLLALLVVAAVLWLSVLREVKAPISSADDVSKPAGRPSAAECAELIAELVNKPSASESRVLSEIRTRLRQCLERR